MTEEHLKIMTVIYRGQGYIFYPATARYKGDGYNWFNEILRIVLTMEADEWSAVLLDGPTASGASGVIIGGITGYATAQGAFEALLARSYRVRAHAHRLRAMLPDVEDNDAT